ncbi:MAG: glycosyltransferase family 2 protein [Lachnospiraceae bacterium]|nr:glycosyltransferase family 2 protein [Lachnospiraceae bacterium]
MHGLTVFTPTYNRKKLLKRVYKSLCMQENKDFVWLIVDDGSSDGTKEEAEGFIAEGIIDIRYIYQENGGKMRAHNRGVINCDTPLFVCLDSDDYFTKNAVNDIFMKWEEIRYDDRYAGMIAHKGTDEIHTLYGARFPDNGDTTLKGLYERGFKGETTLCFKTELLKKNLFPEIPEERYVPEDYVYDKIDAGHIYAVIPQVLTVCEIVKGGYTDAVTKLREENPTGWLLYYGQRVSNTKMSVLKIKYASHYLRFEKRAQPLYKKMHPIPLSMRVLGSFGAAALAVRGKL